MKNKKTQIIVGVITGLAVINIVILSLFSESLADLIGKEKTSTKTETVVSESGQASLSVETEEREYDGKGIFDPLQGVTAQGNDGSDASHKVAVAYVSGKTLQQKTILYTLYDSNGEKLQASCKLTLNDYNGPDITCETFESVNYEDLPILADKLVEKGILHGDDGFGNDASRSIVSSYEFDEETYLAEITFSISNQFCDTKILKMEVSVENIPEIMFASD